jgi:hypothetical protein
MVAPDKSKHFPISVLSPRLWNAQDGMSRALERDGSLMPALEPRRATMVVKITPNDKGTPPGKLAEAELHFDAGDLNGLKLVGFAVWERRSGNGRNVTFPSRQYSVNGERRSFALLRPILDATAQDKVRDLILQAYQEHEERVAVAD